MNKKLDGTFKVATRNDVRTAGKRGAIASGSAGVRPIGLHSPAALTRKNSTLQAAIALAVMLGGVGSAHAFSIDTGNRDLQIRFDNTLRYNLGMRVEERDSKIARSPNADEGDAKFDQGDVITNRLDLLSELDVVYKRRHGMRISAAAWYDMAYNDVDVEKSPHVAGSTSYFNDTYSSHTKRYYRGPSGEILDAFVFSSFDVGNSPVNVKLGRHSVVWGEGLMHGAHEISYRQAPSDSRKAAENPGSETKELFLPVGQFSFQSTLTDTLSLGGQYFFEWQPNRFPEGGTYLAGTDYLWEGPDRFGSRNRLDPLEPDDSGEWGANLRWSPRALNGGIVGAYYREFNEKQGWLQMVGTNGYRLSYAEDTKLYGLSLGKVFSGISVGAELSYRKNAALNGSAGPDGEGPRGNTWHAVLNGTKSMTGGDWFDSAILMGSVAYSRLDKVTENENRFRGEGYAGCAAGQDKWDGCATDDVWQAAFRFMPQWMSAMDGVDITLPIAFTHTLKGNGATMGGGNQGHSTYSIGVEADINKFYKVGLTYADSYAHYKDNGIVATGGNGGWQTNDRGRVTLTLKATY
ncbi:MAG: DUF1302 family protein [Rhodocyclaceae bacterium]|jgi:hypothetical protein|nr:DUF1302 family protein [Rhodocyclaceae bacterium]